MWLPLLALALVVAQHAHASGRSQHLAMRETDPGSGHWVVSVARTGRTLLEVVPDLWQGNAHVYAYVGDDRVGHLWSHFLMFSPGNFLTDRVESEGEHLVSFEVLGRDGEFVRYRGTWRFRDLFTTTSVHAVWVEGQTVFHHVETELVVRDDIPKVEAVWVEFMNAADAFERVAARTADGVVERDMTGTTDEHYLDEHILPDDGWVAIVGPLRGQAGSAALAPLSASHPVRPRAFNGHVDTIELHMLDPSSTRTLKKGQRIRLEYLVLVSDETESWQWVDSAVVRGRQALIADR